MSRDTRVPAAGASPTDPGFRCGSCSHRGHVRSHNEDACLVRPDIGVWAVADGMGGHERGDYASQQVTERLATLDGADDLAALVEGAEGALLSVHEHLRERGQAEGGVIGTTVVALLVRSGHAVVTWAGDSRAYHLRGGILRRISHDHSVVQSLIDRGLLDPDAAGAHPLANRITRAVGAGDPLQLEMDLLPVAHGDRFLLCSDGLDRHVADADIATTLRGVHDPQACANALVALGLARGGADNITCLVVDIATGTGT